MALLYSTRLYITIPLLYFTLLDSVLLYHNSTSLHSTLLYLGSATLYITLQWLYFTLLDSTLLYHGSTSPYYTVYITQPNLYFTLHNSSMPLLKSI